MSTKARLWILTAFMIGGIGGMLAGLALHQIPPPPPAVPPAVAAPDPPTDPAPATAAPAPATELFGFPVNGTEEAGRPAPAAPAAVLYLPVPGKCIAGFDASSTLHDFRGWTKSVDGEIRFAPDRPEEMPSAVIRVDARTLDTGNPDRDAEMHRHLEDERIPQIVFTLDRFRAEGAARGGGPFTVGGTLEVRGRKVSIESPGTFERRSDGYLHAKGEFPVKLSQFGITPPAAALVIRVADEIRIWFDLWARPEGRHR